ncbi:MAG: hypothetical protein QG670_2458 [Thermoproteota archaeon]|nr:hypothetical protein [Thermoproteota archaeon]
MILEISVAFFIIFSISYIVYLIGRRQSPKSIRAEEKNSRYACGEKVILGKFKISLTFYEYLIYFVILDSTSLLFALSAIGTAASNFVFLISYLSIMLTAVLIISRGA